MHNLLHLVRENEGLPAYSYRRSLKGPEAIKVVDNYPRIVNIHKLYTQAAPIDSLVSEVLSRNTLGLPIISAYILFLFKKEYAYASRTYIRSDGIWRLIGSDKQKKVKVIA